MEDLLNKNNISGWTTPLENELKIWSNNSKVYKWLHAESHVYFKRRYHYFIIPVIILSTLTGSANLSINTLLTSETDKTYASVAIGILNLFTGILSTLMNFFKFSERKESHRRSELDYHFLSTSIDAELALPVNERVDAKEFYNFALKEYNRLIQTCPAVRKDAIRRFKKQYKKIIISREIQFPDIICLSDNFYTPDHRYRATNPHISEDLIRTSALNLNSRSDSSSSLLQSASPQLATRSHVDDLERRTQRLKTLINPTIPMHHMHKHTDHVHSKLAASANLLAAGANLGLSRIADITPSPSQSRADTPVETRVSTPTAEFDASIENTLTIPPVSTIIQPTYVARYSSESNNTESTNTDESNNSDDYHNDIHSKNSNLNNIV